MMKQALHFLFVCLLSVPFPVVAQHDSLPRIGVVVSGGMSLFTEDNKDERQNFVYAGMSEGTLKDFYHRLGTGYNLNATVLLHAGRHLAFAGQYRFTTHSATCEGNFDPQDGIHLYWGKLTEHIYVNYAGAGLYLTNLLPAKTVTLDMGISAGMAFFRNEGFQLWSPYLATGKAFAVCPSFTLSVPVTRMFSVVAEGSWMASRMKKMEVKSGDYSGTIDLEKDFYEDLGNISLSIGLKFEL
jgi:hypothetical protein